MSADRKDSLQDLTIKLDSGSTILWMLFLLLLKVHFTNWVETIGKTTTKFFTFYVKSTAIWWKPRQILIFLGGQ